GASGTWFWSGGTMGGSGTTQVAGGGTLTVSGASAKTLTGRTLSILASGTVNLGGTGGLTLSSGGNISNAGTLDNLSDLTISDGGSDGGINNTSLFRKSGSVGTTFLTGVDLTSSGTMQVSTGTLNPSIVNNTGALQISGNFEVDSDTVTLSGASDVSGGGFLQVTGGTLTVNNTDTIPLLTLSNGTINGSGMLSIGTMSWSGGTMSGSGTTIVPNTATMTINGFSAKGLQRGLTVDGGGTVSITGGGTINFGAGSAITNNGLMNFTAGVILNDSGSGGDITNSGTFQVNASGPVQLSGIGLGGAGSLSLLGSSSLNLADGTYSGPITLAAGTSLLIDSDVYTLGAGASVSGSGAVDVSGGQLDVNAAALSISNFTLSNGTLGGTGTLNLPATATWSGGTMTGGGTTSVTPTGTLSITTASAKTLNNRTLSSSAGGTINVTGTGTINLQTSASIANGGTMTLSVDNTFNNAGGAGSIVNTGTFVKTSATGTTLFSALGFTNSGGLVDLQNGILSTNTFTQPSGTLRFKLNGVVAGTQHSQLIISSGTPTFAGTLDITLQGLYQPLGGDTFRVINTTTHLGDFSPYNLPALTGGRTWSNTYDATGLLLTVNGVTDLSIAKSAPFSNVAVGGAIPYSIVVTNNGPDQAQNVTVTDTLAAGHTGISASGTNWNCNVVTLTVTCTATVPLNTGAAPTITINTNAPASPTSFTNIAS
ncbi:MAG TPA: DUF11 domain-containing protein, partial [Thermoanaerobaculia bacterium]|nr:DUF11 domain-containing protein [Thermoanaerobaculia bacterium]